MDEPVNPEQGKEQAIEKAPEQSPDTNFEQVKQGAEILENPPEGSFVLGLQTFIAWVKSLVANNDKT